MRRGSKILVTGASGYLGGAICASLLAVDDEVKILAPIRLGRDPAVVFRRIADELACISSNNVRDTLSRIEIVLAPAISAVDELDAKIHDFGVEEVVHCAACLDYFDSKALQAVNVEFTEALLLQAVRLGVKRFTYISTAFSSGYIEGVVRERLHEDPLYDPTDYTLSKRRAEHLVAKSGLPYLILRPSIVMGHSENGRYAGKRFGVYQLWHGLERLLCRKWHPTIHVFAPPQRLNLVHQDAFQNAFIAAWQGLDNAIVNIVSDDAMAPTIRELWDLWLSACSRPAQTIYYETLDVMSKQALPPEQRALMTLASVNLEIAAHKWKFETAQLDHMRAAGLVFPNASLRTVEVCQQRIIENSKAIQRFRSTFGHDLGMSA